ncbi:LmeA family phospholipid-binding protein [Actinosynnema sp. CS-041913]|uniref:LmeA family phospholipid-binding protein n=1 Tax=Actinosynnema sp. CS-041913 TaxID=3239917 RepID=UPI003D8B2A03
MTSAPTTRRPTRGRKLIIAGLVVVGLLVAADFALAAVGEYQVAQKMRDKFRLSDDPQVRINGFPFITQAMSGDYRDIQITATGVPVRDSLRDLEIQANLRHTRIGLSDLLAGNTRDARIDQVTGSVKIKANDLNRLVNQVTPFSDMRVEPDTRPAATPTPAPVQPDPTKAAVKLSGTTTVASREIKITAYGTVALVGGQVAVAVTDVELDEQPLTGLLEVLGVVKQALSVTIDPGALPFTVTPTAVRVESGALTVEGTINDIPLEQG